MKRTRFDIYIYSSFEIKNNVLFKEREQKILRQNRKIDQHATINHSQLPVLIVILCTVDYDFF
jgi:hypothetical protein